MTKTKLETINENKVFSELMAINEQLSELNDKHQEIRLQAQKTWGIITQNFAIGL